MKIRRATLKDRPELEKLINEFYIIHNRQKLLPSDILPFMTYKDINRLVKTTLQDYLTNQKYHIFVAEENGMLIGYICGQIKEYPDKVYDKGGHIEDWFVSKKYRNKQIGKLLFEHIHDLFKQLKCNHLRLYTFAVNKHVLDIYHKMGFKNTFIELSKEI